MLRREYDFDFFWNRIMVFYIIYTIYINLLLYTFSYLLKHNLDLYNFAKKNEFTDGAWYLVICIGEKGRVFKARSLDGTVYTFELTSVSGIYRNSSSYGNHLDG